MPPNLKETTFQYPHSNITPANTAKSTSVSVSSNPSSPPPYDSLVPKALIRPQQIAISSKTWHHGLDDDNTVVCE